jgi:hypothetical protein
VWSEKVKLSVADKVLCARVIPWSAHTAETGLVILFAQDLACGGVHKMDLLAHGTEDRLILVVT